MTERRDAKALPMAQTCQIALSNSNHRQRVIRLLLSVALGVSLVAGVFLLVLYSRGPRDIVAAAAGKIGVDYEVKDAAKEVVSTLNGNPMEKFSALVDCFQQDPDPRARVLICRALGFLAEEATGADKSTICRRIQVIYFCERIDAVREHAVYALRATCEDRKVAEFLERVALNERELYDIRQSAAHILFESLDMPARGVLLEKLGRSSSRRMVSWVEHYRERILAGKLPKLGL